MNLYLIRHGQTDWNVAGKIQGSTDIPLNDTGRFQARCLMKGMEKRPVCRIYSSPLKRAQETAATISASQGAEVVLIDDLREVSFGFWEGVTWKEAQERYPEEYKRWCDNPVAIAPPGGETQEAIRRRCEEAMDAILGQRPSEGQKPAKPSSNGRKLANGQATENGDIAIVSHGAMLAYLVEYLMRAHPLEGEIIVKNASITTVSYDPATKEFAMVQSNDVSHLEAREGDREVLF